MHFSGSRRVGRSHTATACVAMMSVMAMLLTSACATDWRDDGSFSRTTQSQLDLQSTPSGKVFVDDKYMGITPVVLPLQYGQEVDRKTRKVTYWDTQPGLALLISLASCGLYIPFSFIPVDTDTALEPKGTYTNNRFEISVEAPGYDTWKQEVVARGEQKISFQPQLVKTNQTAQLDGEGR